MTAFADPPLTPKAVATRSRLLELAAESFVERGYAAVSLRDIADQAGVTKGAIYGHFRSKGQLLVEVIRTRLAAADGSYDPASVTSTSTMFEQFVHPGSRELRLLQIDAAAAARHDPDVAAGVAELFAERNRWIAESMDDVPDADTLVFLINSIASGVGVQEAHDRTVPDAATWGRIVQAMFTAGFQAAATPDH